MNSASQLVPVRMLTQYAYCPRLAYLEWVQKEWRDNYFTEDGQFAHRRVNAYTEAVDRPSTRSLTLMAEQEGLVTRLDVLEQDERVASPVEYKRGKMPRGGPREPEKVQLCAQALVLRENGWNVEKGYLYFTQSKERYELPICQELVERTRALKTEMETEFQSGQIPPPLVNDARCGDCSLNSICLPEEVNYLRRQAQAVRPLWAGNEEGQPLYLSDPGSKVGISGEQLVISLRGEVIGKVRLIEVCEICVLGNCQVTTQALRACSREGISVTFLSYGNRFCASLQGLPHKNIELRRAQFRAADKPSSCLEIARSLITSKIANQRVLLRRNAQPKPDRTLREMKKFRTQAVEARSLEALLGLEGMAAKYYFEAFPLMIRGDVEFAGRNRRPPTDPINCTLSFCYSMLAKDAILALHKVGFDPYLGFYHQDRYGRPSLALDLMEEFRPLIADSTVLRLFNRGQLGAEDFYRAGAGFALRKKARKTVITAYEQRMGEELRHPLFGYKASYRRTLTLQARLLARTLMGELELYPGLETR